MSCFASRTQQAKITSTSWATFWVVEMADILLPVQREGTMPLPGTRQVGMLWERSWVSMVAERRETELGMLST